MIEMDKIYPCWGVGAGSSEMEADFYLACPKFAPRNDSCLRNERRVERKVYSSIFYIKDSLVRDIYGLLELWKLQRYRRSILPRKTSCLYL